MSANTAPSGVLDHLLADAPIPAQTGTPQFGDRVEGGAFLGIVENAKGVRERVILLDGEGKDATWNEALKWAELQGGALPTRMELLLILKLRNQFEAAWYWFIEQYNVGSDFAWVQYFGVGGQYYIPKSCSARSLAVRRFPVH
jgi:hypothetical protein